ncbi:Uncharacterised protein [Mycoplasmopsis bovigenitalium]|uniref:Uncharacterized protein n=1 Tax=Mycoplasmopsis bovigenitalium TaxID=2112 RepID=A0A449A9B3_9BACT|nr:Uncharacterised protein [Mycoplasmopsis bovigenitalium]
MIMIKQIYEQMKNMNINILKKRIGQWIFKYESYYKINELLNSRTIKEKEKNWAKWVYKNIVYMLKEKSRRQI